MKVKVVYTTDPTGMSKDVTEELEITNVCIYDYTDIATATPKLRLLETVIEILKDRDSNASMYLHIWKIYSL